MIKNLPKSEARANCPLRGASLMRRGDIIVAMDCSRAEQPVYASHDGGRSWDGTPFQTATFRHNLNERTVREVRNWFVSQGA